jgi:hypothetical protein
LYAGGVRIGTRMSKVGKLSVHTVSDSSSVVILFYTTCAVENVSLIKPQKENNP